MHIAGHKVEYVKSETLEPNDAQGLRVIEDWPCQYINININIYIYITVAL
jgi:hypothetical protein